MAPCLSVCLSVCLCVCHKSVIYRNKRTNRVDLGHGSFLRPILQCVVRKFRYLQKGTSLWNFFPNSGLWKFRHIMSIVEARYQLNLRNVNAHSVINWTVVGQLSWQYLPARTLDHCSLSHRSSSSVRSTILSPGSIGDSWYLYRPYLPDICHQELSFPTLPSQKIPPRTYAPGQLGCS